MYLMRVNVVHNGKELPKGSVCPDDLVKVLGDQGLLEGSKQAEGELQAPPAVEVKVSEDDAHEDAPKKKKGKH